MTQIDPSETGGLLFSKSNHIDCNIPHNTADTLLTLAIIFGIIVSYLPQHLKIIRLKSSAGISPWFLLMGGLSAMANLVNVLVLQAPYINCCFTGSCWQNLLGVAQMFVQWAMFQLIFLLYYWNYPEEAKVSPSHTDGNYLVNGQAVSKNWWLSVQVARALRVWAALLIALVGAIAVGWGLPSGVGFAFAWFLGIVSACLSVMQFLPQIHQTYHSRDSGAISIGAMLMQTPGSFIFCYTLAVSPGVNASTWLTYLIGGTLQGILLIICIYYRYWEPRREYILIEH